MWVRPYKRACAWDLKNAARRKLPLDLLTNISCNPPPRPRCFLKIWGFALSIWLIPRRQTRCYCKCANDQRASLRVIILREYKNNRGGCRVRLSGGRGAPHPAIGQGSVERVRSDYRSILGTADNLFMLSSLRGIGSAS